MHLRLSALVLATLALQAESYERRTFEGVQEVQLELNLGECKLSRSGDGKVHVEWVWEYPEGVFDTALEQKGTHLALREIYLKDRVSGQTSWRVAVPDGTRVRLNTQRGDVEVQELNLELKGSTGTGDLTLERVQGKVQLSTGAGRVRMSECEGSFTVESGTGSMKVSNAKGALHLACGTGDLELDLPFAPYEDLWLKSATGQVTVSFGSAFSGLLECLTTDERGRVKSPWPFANTNRFTSSEGQCVLKQVQRGKGGAKVHLETATGKLIVKPASGDR